MIIIDNHSQYNDKLFLLLKNNNYNANFIFENDRRALNYLSNNITSVVFCDLKFAEKNGVIIEDFVKSLTSDDTYDKKGAKAKVKKIYKNKYFVLTRKNTN